MRITLNQRRPFVAIAAIVSMLLMSGCDWPALGRGLFLLNGGVIIDYHDHGDCDRWYDAFDPDCF